MYPGWFSPGGHALRQAEDEERVARRRARSAHRILRYGIWFCLILMVAIATIPLWTDSQIGGEGKFVIAGLLWIIWDITKKGPRRPL